MAPLFSTPLSAELWTLGFFISLCGLICLRGGKVPRCGLAPILLQYEGWICWRGSGQSQTNAESPKVHTHTHTLIHNVLLCVLHCAVVSAGWYKHFPLFTVITEDRRIQRKILL